MKWKILIVCMFGSAWIFQGIIWTGESLGLWRWPERKTFMAATDNAAAYAFLTFANDAKVNRHLIAVGHDSTGQQTFRWEPPIDKN